MLNDFDAFDEIKEKFSPAHRKQWDDCVTLFKAEIKSVKKIRNDIGGHFGYSAAYYAAGNLDNAGKGLFQFHVDLGKDSSGVLQGDSERLLRAAF